MRRGKSIFSALFAALLAVHFSAIPVSANTEVVEQRKTVKEMNDMIVKVDGETVDFQDVEPIIENQRTLVPLRAIFEAMGATVDWNKEEQTIYATRKNETVQLAIDSPIAFTSGQEVLLDVPAKLYKERTMVPLRFVGEAFGGIVDFDGKNRTITISLSKEQVIELTEASFYLNGEQLSFQTPPIFKGGRNYITLESVLNALDSEIYWTKEEEKIHIQFDGASMDLFVGQNIAFMDEEFIHLTAFPIEQYGVVMVPIRLITEAFGGTAHYIKETEETHLYVNRAKFKTAFLEKEQAEIITPSPVPNARLVGDRRLMVSDNPEILKESTIPHDDVTLWHDEVKTTESEMDHRIFGWHINKLGERVNVGITIENLSTTNDLELKGLKGVNRTSANGWSNYDVGLPVAESVLSNKLTSINMKDTVVKAGETAVIQAFGIEKDYLLGFVDDFTVVKANGSGEMKYVVRTVLSRSVDDLHTIKKEPVELDRANPHPRGTWRASEIETELPVYEAGTKEVAYSISNGKTDNLLSEIESLGGDPSKVIKNSGHYGIIYKIKIPVQNVTGEERTVRVRIGGRGGLYNGAVKTDDGVFITPVLEPMREVANVKDYVINGRNEVIELEVMHAGGAALAMAVDIITIK
ncbi:copper amine oxidase N-terminal domain-containing protein [Bacillus tianshenii]|nr:copper amine oxidase N-terminal domain-containing protein [Bacillus tianshenii]